jgi:hypothetical protein
MEIIILSAAKLMLHGLVTFLSKGFFENGDKMVG